MVLEPITNWDWASAVIMLILIVMLVLGWCKTGSFAVRSMDDNRGGAGGRGGHLTHEVVGWGSLCAVAGIVGFSGVIVCIVSESPPPPPTLRVQYASHVTERSHCWLPMRFQILRAFIVCIDRCLVGVIGVHWWIWHTILSFTSGWRGALLRGCLGCSIRRSGSDSGRRRSCRSYGSGRMPVASYVVWGNSIGFVFCWTLPSSGTRTTSRSRQWRICI